MSLSIYILTEFIFLFDCEDIDDKFVCFGILCISHSLKTFECLLNCAIRMLHFGINIIFTVKLRIIQSHFPLQSCKKYSSLILYISLVFSVESEKVIIWRIEPSSHWGTISHNTEKSELILYVFTMNITAEFILRNQTHENTLRLIFSLPTKHRKTWVVISPKSFSRKHFRYKFS